MRLALFGGTGTVGGAVLAQALEAGHEVRALARTPERVGRSDPRLAVVPGDAVDPAAVAATLAGCDAALSALGGWTGTGSISAGTATVVARMQAQGVRRLVVVQGVHLHFPGDPPGVGRQLIGAFLRLTNRPLVTASEAMAAAIQDSDVDWTVVRMCRVAAGPYTGAYRTGLLRPGPWSTVAAGDAADFALRCLGDPTTIGTAPMVVGRRSRHPERPEDAAPASGTLEPRTGR